MAVTVLRQPAVSDQEYNFAVAWLTSTRWWAWRELLPSTNVTCNPFTPFGDGSLLRMANLQPMSVRWPGVPLGLLRHADRALARLMNCRITV